MKSIFFRVVGAAVILVLILLGIGLVLPRNYDLQTEIVIDAPPASIFPMINRLPNWRLWMWWSGEKNSQVEMQYAIVLEGEGASIAWREPRGQGRLYINRSVLDEEIVYFSQFEDFPRMVSLIRLKPLEDGKTRVVWRSYGKLPWTPFYGWSAMVFGVGLKAQYDRDLASLKELVEREYQQLGEPPPASSGSLDPGISF